MIRGFVLRGDRAAVAAALDRIHFHGDVAGVVERDAEIEVWSAAALPALDDLAVETVELPHDTRAWTGLEDDAPVLVDSDLLVRPPWVAAPAGFVGEDLVVPRGMPFGSGEHGSTQAALLALRDVWPVGTVVATFADVGTGSGILALYAARRGARRILACDVEPESVAAAALLLPHAEVQEGGPDVFPRGAADFVAANLDAGQLASSLDAITGLWSGAQPLVLAGMRPHEVEAIIARVAAVPGPRRERGGFVAVTFTRASV